MGMVHKVQVGGMGAGQCVARKAGGSCVLGAEVVDTAPRRSVSFLRYKL